MEPRLLLAGVVQLLQPSSSTLYGFPTRRELGSIEFAARRYAPFAAHEAVRLTAGLDPSRFGYNMRAKVLIFCTPLPELDCAGVKQYYLDAIGGRAKLVRWADALRAFAKESRLLEHVGEFERMHARDLSRYEGSLRAIDPVGRIERYAGLPFHGRYRVMMSPFVSEGADVVGLDIVMPDGSWELVSGLSTDAFIDSMFAAPSLLWHELSHGTLDTIVDLYWREVEERRDPAFDRCFGDWHQCVKEHLNNAIASRLALQLPEGELEAERALRPSGEFPHMKALIGGLEEYERSRAAYPSLVEFFPKLLEAFPRNPGAAALEPTLSRKHPFPRKADMRRALRFIDALPAGPQADRLRARRASLEAELASRPE